MPDSDEGGPRGSEVPEEARAEAALEDSAGETADLEDPEAPEADTAEQLTGVLRRSQRPSETPDEVAPADLSDQHADVDIDEDDYR